MAASEPAVLLTGVGKRYDIVSAFARHTTVVAVDPNPLAPAQYAAHHRYAVPPITDAQYVPALSSLCRQHGVGVVVPLTDLDLEVLAQARTAGQLSALVPDPDGSAGISSAGTPPPALPDRLIPAAPTATRPCRSIPRHPHKHPRGRPHCAG